MSVELNKESLAISPPNGLIGDDFLDAEDSGKLNIIISRTVTEQLRIYISETPISELFCRSVWNIAAPLGRINGRATGNVFWACWGDCEQKSKFLGYGLGQPLGAYFFSIYLAPP